MRAGPVLAVRRWNWRWILAVRLNADPWLNMPIQADNDYVQRSAALPTNACGPASVYVEYGSRVWNDLFSAGAWVQQQAVKRWPDQPGGPSPYTPCQLVRDARGGNLPAVETGNGAQTGRRACVIGGRTFVAG